MYAHAAPTALHCLPVTTECECNFMSSSSYTGAKRRRSHAVRVCASYVAKPAAERHTPDYSTFWKRQVVKSNCILQVVQRTNVRFCVMLLYRHKNADDSGESV